MSSGEQKAFDRTGRGLQRLSRPLTRYIDFLFRRQMSARPGPSRDWVVDADWARIQQEPVRARRLLYGALITVLLLLLWASVATLDEVARGEGRVIPSRQLQVVQSFDGGAVEEILVREGQVVEAGELLMRIDPTRFLSTYRENRVQYLALRANEARLRAQIGARELNFPDEVLGELPQVAAQQRDLYESGLQELEERLAIAREQVQQRERELEEVQARLRQAERTYSLASQELALTRPLLASGAISEVEVLRLERDVSNAEGEREQARAQIARLESAIAEARSKIREVNLAVASEWQRELSDTLAQLSSLSETGVGLADRLRHSEIRAPVRGTVQRLFVNTVGGVVQPGREVLEMVPLEDQLLIEARIAPRDIAFLRPGQQAMVKFTAYDFVVYGGLTGEVEHISADTITDERDNTFYLVRVRTHESGFDQDLTIMPGMTTQVDILTGKKTVLAYLLKPVLRAKQNALTER